MLLNIFAFFTSLLCQSTAMYSSQSSASQGGAVAGQPTLSTTTAANAKGDQAAALQQNTMLKTALNQITATQMGETDAKKFIPGYNGKNLYCDSRGVDGNWQMINKQLQEECIKQKKDKKEKAEQLAKELTAPTKDDCKIRISKESMVCHARKVMNNVIKDEYYTIKLFGNVVEIIVKNQPVFMGVTERFRYNAKKLKKMAPNAFKNSPTATFKFNRLGGLLSQTGEVPQPKKSNPCAACLEALKQKADSVDGQANNCGGCDSMLDITTIHNGQFRIQNKEDKTDSNNKKEGGKEKNE